jgi:quinolinate synthase
MKKITPEMVLKSLETGFGEIDVPEQIRIKALGSVEKMLGIK